MFLKKKLNLYRIISFLIFFIALFINQYFGNRGIFPIDSFAFFDTGFRVLNGETPFKDYWAVSGPFIDYTQALLFSFFGVNWQAYVLNASILNAILAVLTFKLLTTLNLDLKYSFFYSISLAILAYPISGTPFVDLHSAFLSVISVYILILAIKTKNYLYWSCLPFIIGFAFLSKQVPAAYIAISIFTLIIFEFFIIKKKERFNILLFLVLSSTIFITLLMLVLYFNQVSIKYFIEQYINYPREVGSNRLSNYEFTIKNFIINFKFIYLAFITLLSFNIFNLFNIKNYYKSINFKIFLITFLLLLSLVFHQTLTSNQVFIFFLIPIISSFTHIEIMNSKFRYKKSYIMFLIFLCIFTTLKYNQRFNVERKFHEFNINVDFKHSINAKIIDKSLSGLMWITPKNYKKNKVQEEVELINKIKNILIEDRSKKMIITNYSIFSVLLNETSNSPNRWHLGDASAFPQKDSKSYILYKNFFKNLIKHKKIENIYIISDVTEGILLNYISSTCFKKTMIFKQLLRYKIVRNCVDFNSK